MPAATRKVRTSSAAEALDDMFDDTQLASKLDLSVFTLRNCRLKGEGPEFVKLGKRAVRYKRSAIDAFIAQGGAKVEGGEE